MIERNTMQQKDLRYMHMISTIQARPSAGQTHVHNSRYERALCRGSSPASPRQRFRAGPDSRACEVFFSVLRAQVADTTGVRA
jgi:hypothetical protein